MSESKTKLHVGRDGTPRTCIAQPGNCPVAPGIGHFAKAEQAEAFADKLNELESEGYSYHDFVEKDLKELSDAELTYVSNDIKKKAKENDNYKLYKQPIKYNKEVRTKAQKRMKEIVEEDNAILKDLAHQIDDVKNKRKEYMKEKDTEKRTEKYQDYVQARAELNKSYNKATPVTKSHKSEFASLVDKKVSAEAKFIPLMEKRAEHLGIKKLETDVDGELSDRYEARTGIKVKKPQELTKAEKLAKVEPKGWEEISNAQKAYQNKEISSNKWGEVKKKYGLDGMTGKDFETYLSK